MPALRSRLPCPHRGVARCGPGARACALAPIAAGLAATLALTGCARSGPLGWRPAAAAHYLDVRTQQWLDWSNTARGSGTQCVSCHTTLPYALSRDGLARLTGDAVMPPPQRRLLASVRTRVRLGARLPPYYGGPSTAASRGTEAVLNALILAEHDARGEHAGVGAAAGTLISAPTRAALARMWALQRTGGADAGSWAWLQFHNEPWEGPDSAYYGATLAALAAGALPAAYRQRPQAAAGLARLRGYLLREYSRQPLLNRIDLLWAANALPGLIGASQRAAIIAAIWREQRADGGWNTASLMPGWQRRDGTAQRTDSDGYATGLASLVLQQAGVALPDPRLQRALHWLEHHQGFWTGRWSAASLNRHHGLREGTIRRFMDDSATAFAVMALVRARGAPPATPQQAAAHTPHWTGGAVCATVAAARPRLQPTTRMPPC